MRFLQFTACAALLLALPKALLTQDTVQPIRPAPGARVRVTEVKPPDRLPYRIGTLLQISPDSLAFEWRVTGAQVQLPIDSVLRLEVSRGRPGTHARTGAVVAFLGAGVAAYALLTVVEGGYAQSNLERAGLTLAAALPAGFLGAVLGSLVPRAEQWQSVPLAR